ncbi:hypothetical protein E4U19_000520 [Claviceps sp. Clav32 group G5]|nr:hypothetical protein E4U19_000520 [Claviceps sp. Clav32 group G5]KAG6043660.1 hypothetical protein E4U39_004266 [Claviceps sp. Clav50 group G5]
MVNHHILSSVLLAFAASVQAGAPGYPGFSLRWQDDFSGARGTSPNTRNWNIITGNLGVNGELQTYSSSTRNVQLSGANSLQIAPLRDGSARGGWTSGRLESKYVFTPTVGKITRVEASLRFGSNDQGAKKGIWPAWWMLGNSLRTGGKRWPECGEIDVMEQVNGQAIGHGTMHCQKDPGGICNEPGGIGSPVGFSNNGYHTWRVEFDRRSNDWRQQTVSWYLDGRNFHQVTGARINDLATWTTLCQSPMYFILNVAVGGSWPGAPTAATKDGFASGMEVGYVAHYSQ